VSVPETNPPPDKMTVLQTKLYQAAKRDPGRCFHALYDKLFLGYVLHGAWEQVRKNDGAAGIDHQTLSEIETLGVAVFLAEIAQSLRAKTYRPVPVRRVQIPKGDGKSRPLGIPTVRDRVVQAAAKLVLEPIFEADFEGTPSFGFRPGVGPQEALQAVRRHSQAGYRWVVDADIEQFFDTLDHQQLMAALRARISDGEMLRLIYRWLKAGYLLDGSFHDTDQGSPQGGVLSPLLANVYLHALDQEMARPGKGFTGRLVRYADDFVIQCGTQRDAQAAHHWVQEQVARLGLRLHPEKTRVVNDREAGFDFLGFHHRRVLLHGSQKESHGVLRWPSAKACRKFRARVKWLVGPPGRLRSAWRECRTALHRYQRGWVQYFRHGESSQVFSKLDWFVSERVARNLARSQPKGTRRRRRRWQDYRQWWWQARPVPTLGELARASAKAYRGQAKIRWRAV
jgi:RNA-directed DNA polymerase